MAFSDIIWGVATEALRYAKFSEYPRIFQKLKEASESSEKEGFNLLIELMKVFDLGSDMIEEYAEGFSDIQELVQSFGGHLWKVDGQNGHEYYYDILPSNLLWLAEKEEWIQMTPSENEKWFYHIEHKISDCVFAHIEETFVKRFDTLTEEEIELIFNIPTYLDHTILNENEIIVETINEEIEFIGINTTDLYKIKSGTKVGLWPNGIEKEECRIITINGQIMAYRSK